jgi:hypothetical protein
VRAGVRFLIASGFFLLTVAFRPALESTQPPIRRAPVVLSSGLEQPGREADYSRPYKTEMNTWIYTPSTPYVFITWCLINHDIFIAWYLVKNRDYFTFNLNIPWKILIVME